MADNAKTLVAWNADGRRICKGAKMIGRDEGGAPLFAERDTYDARPSGYRRRSHYSGILPGGNSDHGSGDWDSDPGYSDLDIGCFQ